MDHKVESLFEDVVQCVKNPNYILAWLKDETKKIYKYEIPSADKVSCKGSSVSGASSPGIGRNGDRRNENGSDESTGVQSQRQAFNRGNSEGDNRAESGSDGSTGYGGGESRQRQSFNQGAGSLTGEPGDYEHHRAPAGVRAPPQARATNDLSRWGKPVAAIGCSCVVLVVGAALYCLGGPWALAAGCALLVASCGIWCCVFL